MTRQDAVQALVQFSQPLTVLDAELRANGWDWEGPPLATLGSGNLCSILNRYLLGELMDSDVEAWANMLEGRDDVEFGPDIAKAIFDLANPHLQGSLEEIVPLLLAKF